MNRIDELTQALRAKKASNRCSRCGNTNFEVVGEQTLNVITQGTGLLASFIDQNQAVNVVLVACSHCGNISTHSTGILTKPTTLNLL